MMKKKSLILYVLIFQFFFCGLLVVALNPTIASFSPGNNYDLKSSAVDFSNATVVSDGFNSIYWNDGDSGDPAIAGRDRSSHKYRAGHERILPSEY